MENLPNEAFRPLINPPIKNNTVLNEPPSKLEKIPFILLSYLIITIITISLPILLYYLVLLPYHPTTITSNSSFTKPETSQSQSHEIIHLPNGIEILLISDTLTSKCSASLSVGVGSFQDTDDIKGLAHLTEHVMSFSHSEIEEYINLYMGTFTSLTEPEKTSFYYDINCNGFIHSLMLFAKMFEELTINTTHIERALSLIDIEYENNLNKDEWKENQILKHFANSNHPFNKFSTGNTNTITNNHTLNLTYIQNQVLKFYNDFYSAENMRLVLYSNYNIKAMKSIASQYYSSIKHSKISSLPNITDVAYRDSDKAKWVWYETISSFPSLDIVFILDGVKSHEDTKPLDYITYMLNYQGDGSLRQYLKDKKMITSFDISLINSFKSFCVYAISITPTDYGKHNLYPLIDTVYAYINELKNTTINAKIYNDIKVISDTEFKFKEKSKDIKQLVLSLSSHMFEYEDLYSELLYNDYLHKNFDSDVIKRYLSMLSPTNSIFLIGGGYYPPDDYLRSTIFENGIGGYEPYYRTKYMYAEINKDVIDILKNESTFDNKIVPFNFTIRKENTFITRKSSFIQCVDNNRYFSSKCKEEYDNYSPVAFLSGSPYMKIWYRVDRTYSVPKTISHIHLMSSLVRGTVAEVFALNIFYNYLQLRFDNSFGDLYDAKGEISLSVDNEGFDIVVNSYSDLTKKIVDSIVDILLNDTLYMNEEKYDEVYDYVVEIIKMRKNNGPAIKSREMFDKVIKANVSLLYELESLIGQNKYKLSYTKYRKIIKSFKRSMLINALFYGDVSYDDISTYNVTLSYLSRLNTQSLNSTKMIEDLLAHKELNGSLVIRRKNDLSFERNDIVDNYYQICHIDNTSKIVDVYLLKGIWGNIFSYFFQNENQIAFSVIDEVKVIDRMVYLHISVLGNKRSINEMNIDIDKVLLIIKSKIANMTDSEFELVVKNVKKELTVRENTLKERANIAWREIINGENNFERKKEMIEEIDSGYHSIEEMREMFEDIFIENPKKISIQLYTKENQTLLGQGKEEYYLNRTIMSSIINNKI